MVRNTDDLLQKIQDAVSREYMREAVTCFHAQAYKAAVVLAFTAVLDDLRRKVENLATSGGPANLQQLAADVEQRFRAQEVFESFLLDQLAAHHDVLPTAEIDKLRILRDIRNKCAHPSGYQSSAEEALDVIASGIDIVLSKPLQYGHKSVRELLTQDLSNSLLFPSTWTPEQCQAAADVQLASFHHAAHKHLIIHLGRVIQDSSQSDTIRTNAIGFLRGTVRSATQSLAQLTWDHAISPLVTKDMMQQVSPLLLAATSDGRVESPITRARIPTAISVHVDTPEVISVLAHWLSKGFLDQDEQQVILDALIRKYLSWRDAAGTSFQAREFQDFVKAAIDKAEALHEKLQWDRFRTALDETVVDSVTHHDYYVQNPAVLAIQTMLRDRAAMLPPGLQARYVYHVVWASSGLCKQAEYHVKNGLGARRSFLANLAGHIPTTFELKTLQRSWRLFEGLFLSSSMEDELSQLAQAALAQMSKPELSDDFSGEDRLDFIAILKRSKSPKISDFAKTQQSGDE